MKIIFSRKGFDTSKAYGAMPSPLIRDDFGKIPLISLPIPENKKSGNSLSYALLNYRHSSYPKFDSVLTKWAPNIDLSEQAPHLDPDLDRNICERPEGWRGLFGQAGAAEGHLRNQQVQLGDLFLFYGAFQEAQLTDGALKPLSKGAMKHVIWGYLVVKAKHEIGTATEVPPWMKYHPHVTNRSRKNNVIYEAADSFGTLPGYGVFPFYKEQLCLSAPGHNPSKWRLPLFFSPKDGNTALTYHKQPAAWQYDVPTDPRYVLLQTKSPGQEYVVNSSHSNEVIEWATEKIEIGLEV